jgi:UDP-N-acetyl-D-mannosaminuronate dehydrogenase
LQLWFRICWPAVGKIICNKISVVGFDINQSRINGFSGTDSTLEISEEVLQAVLLDKNHVAIMAFHKIKKRKINESNQWFVLFCYTKRYCGLQLLYLFPLS